MPMSKCQRQLAIHPSHQPNLLPCILKDSLNHFIPNFRSVRKPRFKELLRTLEAIPVSLKVTKCNTLTPSPSSKRKLQIIGPERIVFDGYTDDFVEQSWLAEQVFCYTEPEPEERS